MKEKAFEKIRIWPIDFRFLDRFQFPQIDGTESEKERSVSDIRKDIR